MASQITSLTFIYPCVYSSADQRKHQSSASLAFVREFHRWPVNVSHKGSVTREMFPFDDVNMIWKAAAYSQHTYVRVLNDYGLLEFRVGALGDVGICSTFMYRATGVSFHFELFVLCSFQKILNIYFAHTVLLADTFNVYTAHGDVLEYDYFLMWKGHQVKMFITDVVLQWIAIVFPSSGVLTQKSSLGLG